MEEFYWNFSRKPPAALNSKMEQGKQPLIANFLSVGDQAAHRDAGEISSAPKLSLNWKKEVDRVTIISDLLMFIHSSMLITSLRQGGITHQLQASQLSMTGKWRGICQIAPVIWSWGCNSFLKTEKATIMCTDKAKGLGTQVFCFLSSDAKERSMPGSAQSVPAEQCQAHANLEVCQSKATSVNSHCEAEGTHKD